MTSLSVPGSTPRVGASRRRPLVDRVSDSLFRRALSRISQGSITLDGAVNAQRFGDPSDDGPHTQVTIHDPRALRAAVFGGSLGAGEAYMNGWWTCDDLTAFIRLMLRNRAALEQLDDLWRAALVPLQAVRYRLERNSRAGSRRNIAAHYDLSNEFFALWLDPTMCYSCGVFTDGAETMEQASVAKMDRLCTKLGLRPEHHLLEIGCGWGGLSIHAARRFGCRVTATTISARQAEWARRAVAQAGLSDRVEIIERDYRDLRGAYDRIVSVEMIEAVGAENTAGYFAQCSSLLKPEGLMALQAIVIRDQFFRRAARTRDWLKAYIFPGSCLPSNEHIAGAVRRSTDMVMLDLEDIGLDYARTLQFWRDRFNAAEPQIRALGFDDRFLRMWRFYLSYCEGAFLERHVSDVQIVLAKPGCRTPLAREPRS